MPNYIFGDLPGLVEGDFFSDRLALRSAGIHLAMMAGIDGNRTVGATSIVLNGGYIDDYDLGDEIIYTGHGGNDPNSKKQISDQSWDATGNKGLLVSEMQGLPVRVTRGYKHQSPFSPDLGYRYGGLFLVTEHFEDRGKDGFLICRYRLNKITASVEAQNMLTQVLPEGNDESKRLLTNTLRIVRDTKLAQEIKKYYNYTCQVCGVRISVKGIGYAEAAHIRPLGRPHNGADKPENLLCLCPNHHIMFDKGIFAINSDDSLIGIDGQLKVLEGHALNADNLAYHKKHIYINY